MATKSNKEKVKEEVIELRNYVSNVHEHGDMFRKNIVIEAQNQINKIESDTVVVKVKMEENFRDGLEQIAEIEKLLKLKISDT